jgi:hypothetical protein
LLTGVEIGIGIRHIGVEGGRGFHLYPFETEEKDPLIAGQVGDIVEGAPFAGVDGSPERLFRQISHELADGLVLVSEAGKC